jgi:hypothetical protein
LHDGGMKSLLERYNQLTESQKKSGLLAVLLILGLIGVWLSAAEVVRTDRLGHIAFGFDEKLRYRHSGKLTA